MSDRISHGEGLIQNRDFSSEDTVIMARNSLFVEHVSNPVEIDPEYAGLENVVRAKKELITALSSEVKDDEEIYRIIYRMLTRRSQYQKFIDENGENSLMESFQAERKSYGEMVKLLEEAQDGLEIDFHQYWTRIYLRPEGMDAANYYKVYLTLPLENFEFVKHIQDLAKQLKTLAVETDDVIAVKFPSTYLQFFERNDSIVVHFKKAENALEIQNIINKWLDENEITEEEREMGRTKLAIDQVNKSFSQWVTKRAIDLSKDIYVGETTEQLANKVINFAIEESQLAPASLLVPQNDK